MEIGTANKSVAVISASKPLPFALSFEYEFNDLPDRPPSSLASGYIVDLALQFRPTVPYRQGQPDLAQDWKIYNVIPYVGDLMILEAIFALNFVIDIELVVGPLINHANAEISGTVAENFGGPPRDQPDLNPGTHQQSDSMSVADIESLDLLSPVVHNDPAIG